MVGQLGDDDEPGTARERETGALRRRADGLRAEEAGDALADLSRLVDSATVLGDEGCAVMGQDEQGLPGDAGEGAAVGAVAGGVRGRRARKQAEAQGEQAGKQAAQATNAESRKTFAKSMATCLQGRGYAVN